MEYPCDKESTGIPIPHLKTRIETTRFNFKEQKCIWNMVPIIDLQAVQYELANNFLINPLGWQ